MALQIPLDHFVRSAVVGPDALARSDVQQMKARWIGVDLPFVKILAVFIKHLNAMVVSIVDEHMMSRRVYGHAVHIAEIARTSIDGSARRPAQLAPIREKLSVLVEFRYA